MNGSPKAVTSIAVLRAIVAMTPDSRIVRRTMWRLEGERA